MSITTNDLNTTFDDAVAAATATVLAFTLAGFFGHARAFGVYALSGMTFDGPLALVVGLQIAGISGCVALSLVSATLTGRMIRTAFRMALRTLRSNSARQEQEDVEKRREGEQCTCVDR